jgi:hypothetical protein
LTPKRWAPFSKAGSLLEGGMRGAGKDHLGLGDAALGTELVPVHQHRRDDALGAAGGDRAARLRVRAVADGGARVHEIERHRRDLALEPGGTGADVSLESVHVRVQGAHFVQERVVLRVAAVHRPRALAGLPEAVFLLRDLSELAQDLLPGPPLLGERVDHAAALCVGVEIAHRALLIVCHGRTSLLTGRAFRR